VALRALLDVPAPAKINLFLHVVGKRADGYHLLQSLFVLLDWHDTLHFELRPDGRLARHDIGVALPADDLVLRAARALQAATGTPLGADISVAKALPWGAGLGGGSSDAASTLLALNRLWRLGLPRQALLEIGVKLGADVPFFIGGRNALVEGIGERLTPLEVPRAWYALVKPPAAIETRVIFTHPLLQIRQPAADILAGSFADARAGRVPEGFFEGFGCNDLQPPAEEVCPEVVQAVQMLQARFGNSRMTGSGSVVFARAGTGSRPVSTLDEAALPLGWTGRMCRSLDRHPLEGWAG
jgi:4-diphosphocytidyl-2-C-methyl-D-erythritol kinase